MILKFNLNPIVNQKLQIAFKITQHLENTWWGFFCFTQLHFAGPQRDINEDIDFKSAASIPFYGLLMLFASYQAFYKSFKIYYDEYRSKPAKILHAVLQNCVELCVLYPVLIGGAFMRNEHLYPNVMVALSLYLLKKIIGLSYSFYQNYKFTQLPNEDKYQKPPEIINHDGSIKVDKFSPVIFGIELGFNFATYLFILAGTIIANIVYDEQEATYFSAADVFFILGITNYLVNMCCCIANRCIYDWKDEAVQIEYQLGENNNISEKKPLLERSDNKSLMGRVCDWFSECYQQKEKTTNSTNIIPAAN